MSKSNNLHDYLKDLEDAIRTKVGTTDKINPQEFSNKIKSIRTTSSGNGDDSAGGGSITLIVPNIGDSKIHKIIHSSYIPYISKITKNEEIVEISNEIELDANTQNVITIHFKEKLTTLDNLFFECNTISSIFAGALKTDKVTSMFNVFNYCTNAVYIDVSGWDTSNVTNMSWMFGQCNTVDLIIGINDFDTSKVTDMRYMFNFCSTIERINISNWDCSNVTTMQVMFGQCDRLTNVYLPKKVKKIEDIGWMFILCPKLVEVDMRGWDMSHLKSAAQTFNSCSALENVWMDGPVAADVDAQFFFFSVPETGTFHHNPNYDYSMFTTYLPAGWEFDPYMPSPANLIVYYDVTDTNSPTTICYNLDGFKDIKVDGESIGLVKSYTFNKTGINAVEFIVADEYSNAVRQWSFYLCDRIVKVHIPGTILIVRDDAFYQCTNLKEVVGIDHLLHIGAWAFRMTGITKVKLNDNLVILGKDAFGQSNLEYLEMPANTINTLQNTPFLACPLKTVVCSGSIAPTIYNDTFKEVDEGGTLYVPDGSDYSSWMAKDQYYLGYYNWTVKPLSELPN